MAENLPTCAELSDRFFGDSNVRISSSGPIDDFPTNRSQQFTKNQKSPLMGSKVL